jgi:hypothetical protein
MGELRMLVPTCGSGDPFRALGEAARMFDSPRQRARLLVVITDMQDGQWPHSTWPQPRSRIPARIVQVGRPPQDNVWIAAAGLSQAVVVSGQPNSLEVEIRNGFGGAQRAELLVELDGKPLAHRSLELAANAGTRVDIPFGLDVPARKNGDREDTAAAAARPESESHTLVGRLAREDALAEDNVFYLTARSVSRLPVLLVDGAASGGSRRASSYLRTALHALSREESLRVDNVSLADLDGVDLGPYRLVILSGVSALNEGPLARIEEHVQAGHGLLIFLDASADPRFYNDVEARRPLGGFMQASIGEIVATPPEADPMHVTDAEWEHDVLRRFRGPLRSAVAGIAFRRVYRARPRGAITVASLADDLPLMLERRYGQGRAILFASSPQPEWSDLPLRRNFVSLLNHLTTYLAAGTAPHPDRDVGQELVVSADWKAQGKPAAVTGPDGRTIEAHLRPCGSRVVAYVAANSVSEPGFYRGRTAAVQSGPDAGVAGESWVSAVNCPRGESTPAATTVERMRPFCGGWELAHVDLSAGGSAAPGDARIATEVLGSAETARGLWDTLLWVTLAVLVLEPFVANRASGGVRRADPSQGGAAP